MFINPITNGNGNTMVMPGDACNGLSCFILLIVFVDVVVFLLRLFHISF